MSQLRFAAAEIAMLHGQKVALQPYALWLALSLLFGMTPRAPAGEHYFLIVFSAQSEKTHRPDFAHSFAHFIKVSGMDDDCKTLRMEHVHISWLPKTLTVHLCRPWPEAGANLALPESLQWSYDRNLHLSMWGPFEINEELYDRACEQQCRLESGLVRYKALDTGHRTEHITNCIHAVSDIAFDVKRLRLGSPSWGDAASYFLSNSFRPWIVDPCTTHDWLLEPLGLTDQPIIRRDMEQNPTARPVLRTVQNLAHWHLMKHLRK